ncbi:MAG: hypothetical protein ACO1TE_03780 [Prosthecobacter sp.]
MKTAVADEKLLALIASIQAKTKLNPPVAKSTWKEVIGTSSGDAQDQEAAKLGEEWRRSEGLAE